MVRTAVAGMVVVFAALAPFQAEAKQARCYNSDDGTYACDFRQFGGDGSFSVSAPLKPTYTISIVSQGVADGFADYGEGNIFLPGTFYRSSQDRACWVSDATEFTVCAY
ncbi:MAG: hypothetical protein AAGB11_12320 [Pseudomonadota bacterium]